MKNKLIIANWKMNGEVEQNYLLLKETLKFAADAEQTNIVICPPFVYIPQVAEVIESSQIQLGAQNVCIEAKGAYTGEISAQMLKQFDVKYILVGHSERRSYFNESDEHIALKIRQAVENQQTPVLCVGETLTQRADNNTEAVILTQVKTIIDKVGSDIFKEVVIAYEPIWAIGTGQTATAEQAQAIHKLIRDYLNSLDQHAFQQTQILYGGSVNETNADELIQQLDIDGFLVGSASLKAGSFKQICLAGINTLTETEQ